MYGEIKIQDTRLGQGRSWHDGIRSLSHRILHLATCEQTRFEFLRDVSLMLQEHSGCDAIEFWLLEDQGYSRSVSEDGAETGFQFKMIPQAIKENSLLLEDVTQAGNIEQLCLALIRKRIEKPAMLTSRGSLRISDKNRAMFRFPWPEGQEATPEGSIVDNYPSHSFIPLPFGDDHIGLVVLKSRIPEYLTLERIEPYESIAKALGVALMNERAHAALRERVKELTCLYGLAKIAQQPGISQEQFFKKIADLLPPAWQYPEVTHGRVVVDGESYESNNFVKNGQSQRADIIANGEYRGFVEVIYSGPKPDLDEGPFLKEERNLINGVARQVSLNIERKKAEEDRQRLQDQLRHADRLATIGQLSAGVAHELNEPLGNILGFAQLIQKSAGSPEQVEQDLEKIIKASLHAREIVRKLRLFARETPPQKCSLDINELVNEGLYFIESRCAKAGIDLIRQLEPDLPQITVDKGKIHQVMVNLAVNSIQAMPDGGTLTIRTTCDSKHVDLSVEDTGLGMSKDVVQKIFIPFFTTKDINEGTGLGLAVVHGIVSSHGGSTTVESEPGEGTIITIHFPRSPRERSKEHSENVRTGHEEENSGCR